MKGDVIMATTKKVAEETVKKTTRSTKAKAAEKATKAAAETEVKAAEKVEKAAEAEAKAAEKPAVKRSRKPAAKKVELTTNISIQFAGKSYTNEELVKIAKDVWQYDLKKEEKELQSVELYVKPEESTVYYVFNGNESGSFAI